MNPRAFSVARQVIESADRDHPADALLRRCLDPRAGLGKADASAASRAAFAYFRWKGWLDSAAPLEARIEQALELNRRFAAKPTTFPDSELVSRAVPAWVADEMEVTAAWARALQTEPAVWLRARTRQGSALAAKLGDCRSFGEGRLADALLYRGSKDLFLTPEFHAGEFELQDLSSQAVGLVCVPAPGQTWWDACAGEGGKLLHLSDLMDNRGMIWASDRAAWRLQRLKRRAARARVFNYRMVPWDGGPKLPTRTRFDGVLVDAPCSGIGTWHRNPHARWTAEPRDVSELSQVQKNLLKRAAESVKPGGRLVYSVCTLTRAETSEVAEHFEQQTCGWVRETIGNPLSAGSPPKERLWLWPQEFRGNGMFVAAWTRPR